MMNDHINEGVGKTPVFSASILAIEKNINEGVGKTPAFSASILAVEKNEEKPKRQLRSATASRE